MDDRPRPGTAGYRLLCDLVNTVNRFRKQHPGTSLETILEAVRMLSRTAEAIGDAARENDKT